MPKLSFFRNRFYDQQTGRWTQEDPIGVAGGVNLYGYVGNNPVSFTDPFGLCKNKDGEEVPDEKCRDITPSEGHRVFRSAVDQGQWTWTEGDTAAGQVKKDVPNRVGDCTDFIESAFRRAAYCPLNRRPSTRDFATSTDYRALREGEPLQQADVVVANGHAGVANGRRDGRGRIRAWQNGTTQGTGWMWFPRDAQVYRRRVPIEP